VNLIVGDVSTAASRASNIMAFTMMGAQVTIAGPPTLIPRGIEATGCEVVHSLDRLEEADVVYLLRMQHERMNESFVPSLREYARLFQINSRRLGPRQLVMLPARSTVASRSPATSSIPTARDQCPGLIRLAVRINPLRTPHQHRRRQRRRLPDGPVPIGEPA
jgi:hypothetical protein